MSASPPEVDQSEDIFAVALPPQPYPGLRPFEKSEWPIFFGREVIINEVIERLIAKQFLALHGDSGCGKSSLIRAGVMPRLERDHARGGATWRTTSMLPRNAPLRNLAEALARLETGASDPECVTHLRRILNYGPNAGGYLSQALRRGPDDYICLLVDQFEEIFHFAERKQTEEARQFVELIVGLQRKPPPGLHVALTMRSEFLGACARYEGLAEAFNDTQFLLPRMDKQSTVRALREPARLYGGEVESELLDVLIADAGRGQDQLPLMQHAMMLLQRRKSPILEETQGKPSWIVSLSDYHSSGGVKKLLSDHANAVVDGIVEQSSDPSRAQRVLEIVFRSLTFLDAAGRGVRRPRTLGDLTQATGLSETEILSHLYPLCAEGVSFLKIQGLPSFNSNELVDISHEALIRNWDRLAVWMEEEKRFQVWQEQTERDLQEYEAMVDHESKHPPTKVAGSRLGPSSLPPEKALLTGIRLDRAKWWLRDRPNDISAKMREFIELSSSFDVEQESNRKATPPTATTDSAIYKRTERSAAKPKIYISYSRKDSDFLDGLTQSLEARGINVLIDRRDLAFGEQWAQELLSFVRSADALIFLVSAASIASQWCNAELEEALKRQKRIFPVAIEKNTYPDLPMSIRKLEHLDMQGATFGSRAFETSVDKLASAILIDLDWLKTHTRLSDQAHQWASRGRSGEFLLRGQDLKDAEKWLAYRPRDGGEATKEQMQLIMESRRAATRRSRVVVASALASGLGAVTLAGFSYFQQLRATVQIERARTLLERQMLAREALNQLKVGDTLTQEKLEEIRGWLERP